MIHFPDKTLQRYTLTTGKGVYGETIETYTYADEIIVDFQNSNNQELAHQYGIDLQNLYKIYVDINTTIEDTDQLKDEDGNSYHIIGQIMKYTKFHNYQKIHVVKER